MEDFEPQNFLFSLDLMKHFVVVHNDIEVEFRC